jgi:hypothetical protein
MGNIKLEDIQTIFETLNKSKLEQKGYILIPSFEGFKLFEINEDRLKLYLQAESLHNHAATDTSDEQGALPITVIYDWVSINDKENPIPNTGCVEIKFKSGDIIDYTQEHWPWDEVTHWRHKPCQ